MATAKKKKYSREGESGAMGTPVGGYDKNVRPLTAREVAENKRKRKAANKRK